jgi:hypothetical protein
MSPISRTLVIDASVARAAGGDSAQHPDSVNARDFLKTVLDICHKIGVTPAIQAEWNLHQSDYARKWRSAMVARKKLVPLPVPKSIELREAIAALVAPENAKSAMTKDCHLLEAALAFEQRIASADDRVRNHFLSALIHVREIQGMLWVNPLREANDVQHWLKEGAPDQPIHRLFKSRT